MVERRRARSVRPRDSGAGAITGIGNQLRNTITGNISANLLSGGTLNDTLIGSGGAASLLGDSGDDRYLIDVTSGTDTSTTRAVPTIASC